MCADGRRRHAAGEAVGCGAAPPAEAAGWGRTGRVGRGGRGARLGRGEGWRDEQAGGGPRVSGDACAARARLPARHVRGGGASCHRLRLGGVQRFHHGHGAGAFISHEVSRETNGWKPKVLRDRNGAIDHFVLVQKAVE